MKFARFCQSLSNWAGSSKTFLLAIVLIAVWATTGPYFHYNDTWQLIINTSTTINPNAGRIVNRTANWSFAYNHDATTVGDGTYTTQVTYTAARP